MVIRLIALFVLIAALIVPRLRKRAQRRRAENERRATEERLEAAARALDDSVVHAEDGGPQYRDAV